MVKYIFVLALGRFYHEEGRFSILCDLVQQLIHRIGFACTGRTRDKCMGSHRLTVQNQVCVFRFSHVIDFAQTDFISLFNSSIRYIAAKFCVLNHGQAVYRTCRQTKVHWQFPTADQRCWRIQQTVRRTFPQWTGKNRVHEPLQVLSQLCHL